ncbi:hypothetical protein [Leucothrix pacifica]|uniref:Uncharacterized protein n=1 Tax=Leucothrix pacifica TaxID=1247513 RepID=A0A317CQP5_9GAMM|nr:hypothetical protein [Leucothrix pacifica]PWQ98612.1 hypothetical protein DKW60_07695 [Leucothrix pacifica]
MCGGVFYVHEGEEYRYYFPNPSAVLPVKTKSNVVLMPWGRRKEQVGKLPAGGWARLDSIYAGRWERFFPVSVKIPVSQFMEKDIEGASNWFDITKGKWIQGLVAREGAEQRVYIVTVVPEMPEAIHDRWPRILSG